MQRGRLAVHADVGDVAAGPDQRGGELEGRRDADRLDGDVGAEPAGELADDGERVLAAVVDGDVGAELLGRLEPAVGQVDGDDVARAEQPGAHDRRQADRAGADDGDDVAGLDRAVEHADLVAGGQDVGEHQQLLVGDAGGRRVGRGVGERHPDVLGLGAVDLVAEDPAAAAEALAVAALAAEAARAARGDARHEHPVADGLTVFTPAPTASTVPTASWPRIRPSVTAGTSPLRMCRSVPQIVTASTRTMASVSSLIVGFGTSSHALLSGTVVDECTHGSLLEIVYALDGTDVVAHQVGPHGPKIAQRVRSGGTTSLSRRRARRQAASRRQRVGTTQCRD